MKLRKVFYLIAGIFNCIVGGISVAFSVLVLLLSSLVKTMFESSGELLDEFVNELAISDQKYSYLASATDAEVVSFIMKIVYIFCLVFLIIGAIWITFGVFNILLKNRHDSVFGSKKYLRHLFVVGSWLLLGLNIANIFTTIAVYKKGKDAVIQKLYTANE